MKDKFQCLSCIFSQTLDFVRSSAEDEMDAEAAVRAIFRTMGETDFDREAIAIKRDIGRLARFLCSNGDSFDHFKSRLNRYALEAFPKLVTHVEMAENPLLAALKVSAAVDIFEINTNNHCDLALLKAKLAEVDRQPLLGDPDELYRQVSLASSVLFLLDGAGQVFSDRLLLTQLPREKITLVVGSEAVGTATLEEARIAGLDRMVEVIENGSDAPGTVIKECSEEFRERFERAELVIAKGEGNYESLSGVEGKNFYFLFKARCPILAAEVGCQSGDLVLYHRNFTELQPAGEMKNAMSAVEASAEK
ncbi:MAG TPA: ARMT1-like domain-containing protein [Candidatus Glassbacteria bacterium]|nr:ARMT1-like domain-containing protein [Candidatus Glassbacteria bacterium]